jgi:hypothetical protein
MKRIWQILFLLCLLIAGYLFYPKARKEGASSDSSFKISEGSACPGDLSGRAGAKVMELSDVSAKILADQWVSEHSNELKIRPYHKMIPTLSKNPMGTWVWYRFSQDGIPVFGLSLGVLVRKDGKVISVNNGYRPVEKGNVEAVSNRIESLPNSRWSLIERQGGPVFYLSEGSNLPFLSVPVSARDKLRPEVPTTVVVRLADGQVMGKFTARGETSKTHSH